MSCCIWPLWQSKKGHSAPLDSGENLCPFWMCCFSPFTKRPPPNPLVWVGPRPRDSLVAQTVKNLPAMQKTRFNPWSGRSPGEENGYSLQYSCLGNSMDRGAWSATVHGVAKSQIQLSDWHLHCQSKGRLGTRSRLPRRQLGHLGTCSSKLAVPVLSVAGRDALFGGALGKPVGKSVQTFRILEQDSTKP